MNSEYLLDRLNWRYAVKKFDPSKKISGAQWQTLEECLRLTPSSYGLQPWKFWVIQDSDLRQKLKAVSWNQSQVTDCSHYVVFTALEALSEAHLDRYIGQMARIRNVEPESFAGFKKAVMADAITGPRSKIASEWLARQCYIALGNIMTCAAALGVDACPMEGLDPKKYDEVLGLNGSGYKTIVACAFGFRSTDDKYAAAKKVRFDSDQVFERR